MKKLKNNHPIKKFNIMDVIDEYKLMNAANDYTLNIRKGYSRVMDETDVYIRNAFEAGAKWAASNIQSAIPTNQKMFNQSKILHQ